VLLLAAASPLLLEAGWRAWVVASAPGAEPGAFTVLAVGGSGMRGAYVEPRMSIPSTVEWMLGGNAGGRRIVTHVLADHGHSIYPQAVLLERALAGRGDAGPGVVLVYSGHNEGIGPDAADSPAGGASFLEREVESRSWLVRDLAFLARERGWLDRRRDLRTTEHWLRRVAWTARDHGLVPILASEPSNVGGIEPNVREDADAAAVRAAVESGDEESWLRRAGDQAAGALFLYLAGKARRARGAAEGARGLLLRAIDRDPRNHFGRATSAQHDLVRRVAAEEGVPLVDAPAVLAAASPDGIPDGGLFGDGHHPGAEGYRLIAAAFAARVAEVGGDPAPPRASAPLVEVEAALGVTPSDRRDAAVRYGSWLVATAAMHPWPDDRLALAGTRFREALDASPDDPSALLGVAIAQAGRAGGLLRDREALDALHRWHVFYSDRFCVPPEERAAAMRRLGEAGADGAILARLDASKGVACGP